MKPSATLLDAISSGHTATDAIARHTGRNEAATLKLLRQLEAEGAIYRTKGKGKPTWCVATDPDERPWKPYVPPPAPPRRPGSDHSHIPSMAGGKRIGALV